MSCGEPIEVKADEIQWLALPVQKHPRGGGLFCCSTFEAATPTSPCRAVCRIGRHLVLAALEKPASICCSEPIARTMPLHSLVQDSHKPAYHQPILITIASCLEDRPTLSLSTSPFPLRPFPKPYLPLKQDPYSSAAGPAQPSRR